MRSAYKATITENDIYSLCYWISEQSKPNELEQGKLNDEDYCLSIIALANKCWLIGALSNGIKKKKSWDKLPVIVQEYLTEICQAYERRSLALIDEVFLSVKALNEVEIVPILLKGAATLLNGVSNPRYIRYMNDIDILVKPEQLLQATEKMVDSGYMLDDEAYDINEYQHHHQSPMKRIDSTCYIELHRWHTKKTLLSILPSDELWDDAREISTEGKIKVKECSATHQVIVNIVHSELSDRGYFEKNIQLFQLVALYQLANFYQEKIDWQIIVARFSDAGLEEILFARLYALKELFNVEFQIDCLNLASEKQKAHFKACLLNYVQTQNSMGLTAIIKGQLSEYSQLSIKAHYGVDKFLEVQLARCKILKEQFKKLFSKGYLKKFYLANFR